MEGAQPWQLHACEHGAEVGQGKLPTEGVATWWAGLGSKVWTCPSFQPWQEPSKAPEQGDAYACSLRKMGRGCKVWMGSTQVAGGALREPGGCRSLALCQGRSPLPEAPSLKPTSQGLNPFQAGEKGGNPVVLICLMNAN